MRALCSAVRDAPVFRAGFTLLLLAPVLMGAPVHVTAQTPLPGDRVRVTVGNRTAVYDLLGIHGDTLVLGSPKATLRIPFADVDRLELGSLGPPGKSGRTTLAVGLGAVIGGAAGGLVAAAVVPTEECEGFICVPDFETMAIGATIGAALGAGIVFMATAGGHPGWSWDAVDTTRLNVRAAPRPFGIGLGVTVRP